MSSPILFWHIPLEEKERERSVRTKEGKVCFSGEWVLNEFLFLFFPSSRPSLPFVLECALEWTPAESRGGRTVLKEGEKGSEKWRVHIQNWEQWDWHGHRFVHSRRKLVALFFSLAFSSREREKEKERERRRERKKEEKKVRSTKKRLVDKQQVFFSSISHKCSKRVRTSDSERMFPFFSNYSETRQDDHRGQKMCSGQRTCSLEEEVKGNNVLDSSSRLTGNKWTSSFLTTGTGMDRDWRHFSFSSEEYQNLFVDTKELLPSSRNHPSKRSWDTKGDSEEEDRVSWLTKREHYQIINTLTAVPIAISDFVTTVSMWRCCHFLGLFFLEPLGIPENSFDTNHTHKKQVSEHFADHVVRCGWNRSCGSVDMVNRNLNTCDPVTCSDQEWRSQDRRWACWCCAWSDPPNLEFWLVQEHFQTPPSFFILTIRFNSIRFSSFRQLFISFLKFFSQFFNNFFVK